MISQQVSIVAANHNLRKNKFIYDQPWSEEKNFVEIADDVWIGCVSKILPGVKIGKRAVIAAGSVVTKSIPDYAIAVGNPAKVINFRSQK